MATASGALDSSEKVHAEITKKFGDASKLPTLRVSLQVVSCTPLLSLARFSRTHTSDTRSPDGNAEGIWLVCGHMFGPRPGSGAGTHVTHSYTPHHASLHAS